MREYGPGRPLVFNHIPKSAGNSLRVALVDALQPQRMVRTVDLSLLGGYTDFDALRDDVRAGFIFDPAELDGEADFVTGHISPGTTMQRFPDADHLTMLRNPRLRIVSQWMHGRALTDFDLRHWGRGGAAFRTGRLPFRDYLQHQRIAPSIDNTVARFLAYPHPLLEGTEFIPEKHDDEILGAATERLDSFAHVGVVENSAFLADLSTWLGRDLKDTRLNERTTMPRSRRPDLDVEFADANLELLDHRTRLDRELWRRVAAKVLPDPDEALRASWERSVARYAEALRQPQPFRPVKHTLDAVYGVPNRIHRWRVDRGK